MAQGVGPEFKPQYYQKKKKKKKTQKTPPDPQQRTPPQPPIILLSVSVSVTTPGSLCQGKWIFVPLLEESPFRKSELLVKDGSLNLNFCLLLH
jgi:hypothetical protein